MHVPGVKASSKAPPSSPASTATLSIISFTEGTTSAAATASPGSRGLSILPLVGLAGRCAYSSTNGELAKPGRTRTGEQEIQGGSGQMWSSGGNIHFFRVFRLLLRQFFVGKDTRSIFECAPVTRTCSSMHKRKAEGAGGKHESKTSNKRRPRRCQMLRKTRSPRKPVKPFFLQSASPPPRRSSLRRWILPLLAAALLDPAGLDEQCWHTGGISCTPDTAVSVTALSLSLPSQGEYCFPRSVPRSSVGDAPGGRSASQLP